VTATAAAARPRILLTIGDPNGIGPEVAVKAARALAGTAEAPVLVGDRHVLTDVADGQPLRRYAGTAPDPDVIDVVDVAALQAGERRPGTVTAAAGAATVAYLQAALELVRSGQGRAIVGCPHSETAINDAGIAFSGYPSLLARLLGVPAEQLFLLLVGGGLRIAHVTLHERLADALQRLTPELVVAAAAATTAALPLLGIESPHIGVFGINPHAGENGLFGDDDERIVRPALAELRRRGLRVDGPAGADVLIRSSGYDAFVAMYHDQGHIPVKLLAGTASSALTIGAGVLFASVGHGAAFDIAGRNAADPTAVIDTIRLLGAASPPDEKGTVR
jgi:4-hydroxy-L-threonine phosphate dehydrogenase PdxA